MKIKSESLSLVLLALSVMLAGCAGGESDGADASGVVRVVATTGMIADVASRIGGERVRVTSLMGAGVDPHLYKASEGDVRRLADSDVIFYNGLHLEAGMGEVLERLASRKRTIAVAQSIDQARLLAPPEFKGAFDPHVWFDVSMWRDAAMRVRDSLAEHDPANADYYRRNSEAYLAELDRLHTYVRERAQVVPAEQRVLVTAHDAFNYFGRAYGFEVRGLQGISTATEAGTADVQALAQFIADRRIRAIFVESSIPQRTIEAVQEAVRARGFETRVGGQLYSDAMGNPGTPQGTYVGMVRHNIDTIANALISEN